MKPAIICGLLLQAFSDTNGFSQVQPVFGPEILVTIQGLTFDAMEPALSADGKYLFFNSLNDGVTTSLFYASRQSDSAFIFAGALTGANQSVTPRLDAVASADSSDNFYWTSLRQLSSGYETCFHGKFNGSDVVNIGPLHGNFYVNSPGWVMMDASVDLSGNQLFYTNAYFGSGFTGCNGVPCKTNMGIATWLNDSTFNRLPGADTLLRAVNDTNYASYAPHITSDGLELYFSRFKRSDLSLGTQMCVSVRSGNGQTFGPPQVIHDFSPLIPEAACLSVDAKKMYYHRKRGNVFVIYLRYRLFNTEVPAAENRPPMIFPNPTEGCVTVALPEIHQNYRAEIFSVTGERRMVSENRELDLSQYGNGVFYVRSTAGGKVWMNRIVKITR